MMRNELHSMLLWSQTWKKLKKDKRYVLEYKPAHVRILNGITRMLYDLEKNV